MGFTRLLGLYDICFYDWIYFAIVTFQDFAYLDMVYIQTCLFRNLRLLIFAHLFVTLPSFLAVLNMNVNYIA